MLFFYGMAMTYANFHTFRQQFNFFFEISELFQIFHPIYLNLHFFFFRFFVSIPQREWKQSVQIHLDICVHKIALISIQAELILQQNLDWMLKFLYCEYTTHTGRQINVVIVLVWWKKRTFFQLSTYYFSLQKIKYGSNVSVQKTSFHTVGQYTKFAITATSPLFCLPSKSHILLSFFFLSKV